MTNEKSNGEEKISWWEIAMAEMRLLQQIIDRYDNNEIKIRSWLLTLLSALIVATISNRISTSVWILIFFASGVTLSFAAIEMVHRVPKRKAVKRVSVIEKMLRGEEKYNGPLITDSLMSATKPLEVFVESMQLPVLLPVLGFYGLVLALALMLFVLIGQQ